MPPFQTLPSLDDQAAARRAALRFHAFLDRELARGDLSPGLTASYREQLEVAKRVAGPVDEVRHIDDVVRGAIRLDEDRVPGEFCCLVPDAAVDGRWITIAAYDDDSLAAAFCAGYCAHRDQEHAR